MEINRRAGAAIAMAALMLLASSMQAQQSQDQGAKEWPPPSPMGIDVSVGPSAPDSGAPMLQSQVDRGYIVAVGRVQEDLGSVETEDGRAWRAVQVAVEQSWPEALPDVTPVRVLQAPEGGVITGGVRFHQIQFSERVLLVLQRPEDDPEPLVVVPTWLGKFGLAPTTPEHREPSDLGKVVTEEFVAALRQQDKARVFASLYALTELGLQGPDVTSELQRIAEAGNPVLAVMATAVLAHQGNEKALTTVVEEAAAAGKYPAQDFDPEMLRNYAQELGPLTPPPTWLIESTAAFGVRQYARSAKYLPGLSALAQSPTAEEALRAAAVSALSGIDAPEAFAALYHVLQSADEELARQAALSLHGYAQQTTGEQLQVESYAPLDTGEFAANRQAIASRWLSWANQHDLL